MALTVAVANGACGTGSHAQLLVGVRGPNHTKMSASVSLSDAKKEYFVFHVCGKIGSSSNDKFILEIMDLPMELRKTASLKRCSRDAILSAFSGSAALMPRFPLAPQRSRHVFLWLRSAHARCSPRPCYGDEGQVHGARSLRRVQIKGWGARALSARARTKCTRIDSRLF